MSKIPLGTPGFCYLLSNESMKGMLKIGATTDLPEIRAKQLTAATASPTPFVVLYSREVSDCTLIEEKMHRAFAAQRVNEGREFFRVSLFEAAKMLDSFSGNMGSLLKPLTPFANLFATFDDDGTSRKLNDQERAACRKLEAKLLV